MAVWLVLSEGNLRREQIDFSRNIVLLDETTGVEIISVVLWLVINRLIVCFLASRVPRATKPNLS